MERDDEMHCGPFFFFFFLVDMRLFFEELKELLKTCLL